MTLSDSVGVRGILRLAGIVVLALAASGLGGCKAKERTRIDVLAPEGGWSSRTMVDIENFNGEIELRVDPSLREGRVKSVAVATKALPRRERKEAVAASEVDFYTSQENGTTVIRGVSTIDHENPDAVRVRMKVWVPAADGVTIRNRGGNVELVGVKGPIRVSNAPSGDREGRIEVRTNEALNEPVELVTAGGNIMLQVPRETTGRFTLLSGDQEPEFFAPAGEANNIRLGSREVTFELNRGTTPFVLRSDDGLVRVMVLDEPEAYTNLLR